MNATVGYRVIVSQLRNLLEKLPKKMSVLLARFMIRPSFTKSVIRGNDGNEVAGMTERNDISGAETDKLVNDLRLFIKFACSRIDRTPREKHAAISRQYDFRRRVEGAAVEARNKRMSLAETRSELDKYVTMTSAEIKMNRLLAVGVSTISAEASYVASTTHCTREREAEIMSLKAETALFDEMSERVKEINASRKKDLKKLRLDAEKRCLATIEKYDGLIGARHRLLAELTREANNLRKGQEFSENRALVQGILYAQLKKERDVRLIADFTRKLQYFQRNRAANIIQIAWRSYYEQSSAKRRRRTKRK